MFLFVLGLEELAVQRGNSMTAHQIYSVSIDMSLTKVVINCNCGKDVLKW